MRKNTGDKEEKTRDLFLALWIPDEFMRRVEADQPWSLMCPHKCPGLSDVWGDDFVKLYKKCVFLLLVNTMLMTYLVPLKNLYIYIILKLSLQFININKKK